MAEIRGAIHVCLPFSALEPILGTFEQGTIERKENRSDVVKVLRCLMRVPVSVGCELPPTMVSVNDLLSITNGDILRLDSKVDDRVRVVVGGTSAFEASLVNVDGRKGVGIVGRITG
jgi:flagellar motor switch protein FliM